MEIISNLEVTRKQTFILSTPVCFIIMKYIKAIIIFITIVLISMVLRNLLWGSAYQTSFVFLKSQLFGMIYAVPFIATSLIFASEMEKPKKLKWMWGTLGIYFFAIILSFPVTKFLGGDELAAWYFMAFVGVYLVGMTLPLALLSYLLKFEEKKQMKIIITVIIITLLLNVIQSFGLFRLRLLGF